MPAFNLSKWLLISNNFDFVSKHSVDECASLLASKARISRFWRWPNRGRLGDIPVISTDECNFSVKQFWGNGYEIEASGTITAYSGTGSHINGIVATRHTLLGKIGFAIGIIVLAVVVTLI